MNTEQKQRIADSLRDYLQRKEISQNEFAKRNQKIISTANVSNLLNGKWEKISESIFRQVAAVIGETSRDWPLVKTTNFNKIQALCHEAQNDSLMMACCGYAGAGKTTALRHYADNNPNVFYAHFDITVFGRKEFLNKILEAMGLELEGNVAQKTAAIINKLKSLDRPVLILDQVDKVSDANKLIIQAIYDETEFQAGIVLAGTNALKKYLDKMAAKDKIGFRELRSRISYWQPMYKPSKGSVTDICRFNGISDGACIEHIYKKCESFRAIRHLVHKATKLAQRKGNGSVNVALLNDLHMGEHEFLTTV